MEKPSVARLALKWGLIAAVVNIVSTLITNISGMSTAGSTGILLGVAALGLTILLLIMAMREYRTLNEGYLSYGEGLGLGTLLCAVSGVVAGGFNVIYMKFVDTTLVEKRLNDARNQLEAQGMSDEQIDQAMNITSMMMSPGVQFVVGIFGGILIGFVLSLIVAAFLKRDKPVFD